MLELSGFRARFRKNDTIAAVLTIVALLFALLAVRPNQNEIYWRADYSASLGVHFMRTISMILSLANLVFIYHHHALRLELMKAYKLVDPTSKQ
jgi:hypothetical protein